MKSTVHIHRIMIRHLITMKQVWSRHCLENSPNNLHHISPTVTNNTPQNITLTLNTIQNHLQIAPQHNVIQNHIQNPKPKPHQKPIKSFITHHISATNTTAAIAAGATTTPPQQPPMALARLLPPTTAFSTTTKPPKNPTLTPPIHAFHSITTTTRHRRLRFRCSASNHHKSSLTDTVELPLFPLPLVLFPGAVLPLQIFEFRYRIMMHTLLHTDLRFGVVFSDSASGNADVGCVAEVVKHECLADDRFFLICKGQERFRIDRITRSRPYLVAEVSWLEDKPSKESSGGEEDDLEVLSVEVEAYMRDVIRLSNRLNGKGGDEKEVGDLRRKMWPTPFSFFVGSTFEGAPREQQALLELEDTAARLRREKDTLRNTLNYLSAASAVKDVFPSSSTS
ncbi:hypothetical protein Droror1_Dr00007548 [Drosera rotundifolia]